VAGEEQSERVAFVIQQLDLAPWHHVRQRVGRRTVIAVTAAEQVGLAKVLVALRARAMFTSAFDSNKQPGAQLRECADHRADLKVGPYIHGGYIQGGRDIRGIHGGRDIRGIHGGRGIHGIHGGRDIRGGHDIGGVTRRL
jgi:hypothetical protein